jgi:steroid 5-alpha reductase family enzyme
MTFLTLWLYAALLILGLMTALWLLSLALKDSSIVDIFWGTGFVITFWVTYAISGLPHPLSVTLLGVIVTLWGLRLSLYIFSRNAGHGEDFRYAAWREENGRRWWWFSFFKVFLLQGVIMAVVSAPLLAAQFASPGLGALPIIGALVWLVGFIFEAGGDWQLARFKANPDNKGKLLTTGLWGLTRHPNYFGDATQWWGFWLFALAAGGWWTVFSPIIMTFLLVRVSGVAMLEKSLKDTKPGYAEYLETVPAFVPRLLPRRRA